MQNTAAELLFNGATEEYYQGDLQKSLDLLSECLLIDPSLSIPYSNMAVINHQLGNQQQAIMQLKQSIRTNYLNYVSYFNIFSLQIISKRFESAFTNLCLALSSIHTHYSKARKNDPTIMDNLNKAIFYSFNNRQALLLKGNVMLTEDKSKARQVIGYFKDVIDLQRGSKWNNIVQVMINAIEKREGIEITAFSEDKVQGSLTFELLTLQEAPSNYHEVVNQMLAQFTEMFHKLTPSPVITKNPQKPKILNLIQQIQQKSINRFSKLENTNYVETEIGISRTNYEGAMSRTNERSYKRRNQGSLRCSGISEGISSIQENKILSINSNIEGGSRVCQEWPFLNEENKKEELQYQYGEQKKKAVIHSLRVKLSEQVNLSRPYCLVFLGQKPERTQICSHHSNAELSFKEEFSLEEDQAPQIIKIKLLQKNFTSFEDTLIGTSSHKGRQGQKHSQLRDSIGRQIGRVYLQIK